MSLNIQNDLSHYLNLPQILLMFLLAIITIAACTALLFFVSMRMYPRRRTTSRKRATSRKSAFSSAKSEKVPEDISDFHFEVLNLTERLFELIFSSTFILLFVALYFTIDYFGVNPAMQQFWNEYNAFILLIFILFSVMLNSMFDKYIIPLKYLRAGDKSSLRLIGMIYMLIIFLYIKFIYEDSNYDSILLYFLTLIIGRFVYFDATLQSFTDAMKSTISSLPLLGLTLLCSGIMAWYGFASGYLMRLNGVVLNLFLAHLFLLVVIFIVNRTHLIEILLRKLS